MASRSYLKSVSKFLSYVLRHHPESIGLTLDEQGWGKVSELIVRAQAEGRELDESLIREVMSFGDKQRFILSEDKQYIRAGYGHSVDVELQLHPKMPPGQLYHGTAKPRVSSIIEEGIKPGSRNFVHLSATRDEAKKVGSRHGPPVILTVEARQMSSDGHEFFQSESEPSIWLTKKVPAEYVGVD